MSILFILLKLIAIILAVILFFLLLCLFHPVFYQVKAEMEEMKWPKVEGKFWWLFQILGIEIQLKEGNITLKLRIFGMKKTLSRESSRKESEGFEEELQKEEASKDKSNDVPQEKESSKKISKKSREKKTKEKKAGFLSALKKEIADESNKLAVTHVFREIVYLFSHLKPKSAKGEIHFSTTDPALTGKVTGVLSLFPICYKNGLHIYPDFAGDAYYVRGYLKVKGHLALYRMVLILIRLFGDKNIRKLIKKIRK